MVEERILTINLRKKLLTVPRWKRNKEAIKILRNILKKHIKVGKINIDKSINESIWSKSKPETKLRVKISKIDDKTVKAELMKK